MSQKINLTTAPRSDGTLYPTPYDEPCRARRRIKVGDAAGQAREKQGSSRRMIVANTATLRRCSTT